MPYPKEKASQHARSVLILCLGAIILMLLAGCGEAPPSAARELRAYVLTETGLIAIRASDGTKRWQFQLPQADLRTVASAVSGGQAYVATDTMVYALDTTSGRVLWAAEAGPQVQALLVAGETVYVSSTAQVYALRAHNGSVLWSLAVDGQEATLLTLDGTTLYVGGNESLSLLALEALTGAIRWTYQAAPDDPVVAIQPAGQALVVQTHHALLVLNAGDGGVRWQQALFAEWVDVQQDLLYLAWIDGATGASGLRALRLSDGGLVWQTDTEVAIDGEPVALTPETIFRVTGNGAALSAWRTSDGTQLWQQGLNGGNAGVEAEAGKLFVAAGTTIEALQALTGMRLWQRKSTGALTTLQSGQHLLYGVDNQNGWVLALRPATGAIQWQTKLNDSIIQMQEA